MTTLAKVRHLLNLAKPRREGTPGQLDQERETAVSLGLMADAKAAGAEMTDEQAIFLSSSMEGMRNRISVLLGVPDRSLAQDRELVMIQRELARLEGRTDAPVLVPREEAETGPKRFLGPITANLGLYGMIAAGVGVVAILGWWQIEVNLLKAQRDRACRDAELVAGSDTTRQPCITLGETQRQLEHSRGALAEATQMVRAADQNAMRTADTLRRLERQRAQREAQQRRTARELESLHNGLGEPPELGLHDANPAATGDSPN